MTEKGSKVLRFLSSGKFENLRDESIMDEMVRYVIYNVAILFGATFLIIFGFTVILEGNMARGTLDLLLGSACIIVMLLLRTKVPFVVCGLIPLAPFCVLCTVLVVNGGEQGFAGLWVFSYPLLVIFILGLRVGSILSGLLLAGILAGTLVPGLAGFDYVLPIALRIIAVYILVLVLAIGYERIRILKDRWGKQLTRELKAERDEIAAMKDNLKVGLFLMDRDYVIQPAYSKALGDVLGMRDLSGKKFPDLLSSSIKARDRDTLQDYFTMILNRSFDAKMLEEINPISEFSYIHTATGDEKILRSSFAIVDRGSGSLLFWELWRILRFRQC
jgi:hypothetical protein